MKRGVFRVIAVSTLPIPFGAAYLAGQPVVSWIKAHVSGELGASLGALAAVLIAIPFLALWGAILVPFRARAGFTPIAEELKSLKDLGSGGLDKEIQRQRASAKSSDPAVRAPYHYMAAGISALLAVFVTIFMLFFLVGEYIVVRLALPAFCMAYSLYHLARGLFASAEARRAAQKD